MGEKGTKDTGWGFCGDLLAIYCLIFVGVWLCLWLCPPPGGYVWDSLFINVSTSALFTLLVALTARLVEADGSPLGLLATALFLFLFCPGAERFFLRDEAGLLELASQCMVPFFIRQYMDVSQRHFGVLYFLMLLMGVFCSYTHNSITIPLCATFLLLSFLHRGEFFHRACWPMVVGFVIGTGLSIWDRHSQGTTGPTATTATVVFHTLWDTKVILLSLAMSAYLATTHNGRKLIVHLARRHYILSLCLAVSWLSLPFAPLGMDNAVSGVCFFSMLWALSLCQHLVSIDLIKRLR